MFAMGDNVLYGADGVCTITEHGMRDFFGSTREYYILKPNADPSGTVYVPADNPALVEKMRRLMTKEEIDGILVQLPLPAHLDQKEILSAIDPAKDVDAFHPQNVGHIVIGDYFFAPCTPSGILTLIDSTGVDMAGKECVIIGRSNIVGKPMALLALHRNATVTVCHSKTKNLPEVTRRADILISAVGKAGFVTGDMVKPGAVVIDVGMNRNASGKLCGDIDSESVMPVGIPPKCYIFPGSLEPKKRWVPSFCRAAKK